MSNDPNSNPKKSMKSQNVQFEGGYDNSSEGEYDFEGGSGARRRTGSRNPEANAGQQYQQLSGGDTARGLINDNMNAQPYSGRSSQN